MEEEKKTQRRKSILKETGLEHKHETDRNLQWDEECIKEHDKERGSRHKVDEPKTPYAEENEGQPLHEGSSLDDIDMKDE